MLAGGCCPCNLLCSGFGSNVSLWLGPPCMNREITLFAVAGHGGVLGASGLAVAATAAAPADRWNIARAASHPIPSPEVWRNPRRESSIHIDKLVQVEQQQAQPRQGIPLQIIEGRLALLRARKPSERQPPTRLRRSFRILACLLRDPRRELLRLRPAEFAVHQLESLRRDR